MNIAFIIQRYGTEIIGGSEYHCRLVAERLASRHDVEILTTCARDYISWKNEYAEGTDRIRGVTVRRFSNDRTRNIDAFNKYSDWIFHNKHSASDEDEWLKQQGPWCPGLIDYLKKKHASYDALIFFTYLYAPTVMGLKVAPKRSILVPTAHDEPAIRLGIYRDVFRLPAGIAFNTGIERAFLKDTFEIPARASAVVGCGVDVPKHFTMNGSATEDQDLSFSETLLNSELEDLNESSAATFRRRHRLFGPYALYGGRIDPGKGCEELIANFGEYSSRRGDATLALMGAKLMPIPEEPYIRFAGLLPEHERLQALNAATVVVVPSPYESLSLLTLEAFAVGTPVLANARSDVVTDHCQRSNGGLYYADQEEFVACLSLLMQNGELRTKLGKNGQAYVRDNYEWDVIMDKYDTLLAGVSGKKPFKSKKSPSPTRGPRGRSSGRLKSRSRRRR